MFADVLGCGNVKEEHLEGVVQQIARELKNPFFEYGADTQPKLWACYLKQVDVVFLAPKHGLWVGVC